MSFAERDATPSLARMLLIFGAHLGEPVSRGPLNANTTNLSHEPR